MHIHPSHRLYTTGHPGYLEEGLMLYFSYDHRLTYIDRAPPGAPAHSSLKTDPADYDLSVRFPGRFIAGRNLPRRVRLYEVRFREIAKDILGESRTGLFSK